MEKTKHKIKITKGKRGVTIWVNERWILDASCFEEDMELTICTKRMKKQKLELGWKEHQRYRFDKRYV